MNRYVIDRAAIARNAQKVIRLAGVPVMGVVKANGYGFGLREMARILGGVGVTRFAVTEVEDLALLREVVGADAEVLVMRSTALADEARAIVGAGCIATVGSLAAARAAAQAAGELGTVARCHLKVDTGFGRYGFLPQDMPAIIACYRMEGLRFEGMYTHFSAAYHDVELTCAQLAALEGVAQAVRDAGYDPGVRHAANSPALFNVPEAKLDMVRVGSAFAGRVITLAPHELERVGFLEAQVIDLKTLPAGSSVGYGGEAKLARQTRVAFVSAGTQEGFGLAVEKPATVRRALSAAKGALAKRHLTVEIDGRGFPVIGEADLSLTLVDVTDAGDSVHVGDVARMDVNPLMVSPKVPRVYV